MFFVIYQPGTQGHLRAMIRRKAEEFTPQTAGKMIHGPVEVPQEIHMLFQGEFLDRLPGEVITTRLVKETRQTEISGGAVWPMKMQFIAEALILQGWQLSSNGCELCHIELGLPDIIREWMRSLSSVRAAHFTPPLFRKLRELGFTVHATMGIRRNTPREMATCH